MIRKTSCFIENDTVKKKINISNRDDQEATNLQKRNHKRGGSAFTL